LVKFLITSKASDVCKLSTLCEIPLYSGGAKKRRLRRIELYAASLPPRRQGEERTRATQPFDFAQGHESFDLAQDPEVLEGPVEWQMMS
jgi:hypothetical protein